MANPGGSEQKFRIIIHSSSRVQRLAAGDSSVAVRAVLEGIIINGFYIKFKFFGRGRTRFPRCALPVCLARNWPLSTWFRWRSTLGQARAHCSCICIGKEYKINETLFCAVVASIIYSAFFLWRHMYAELHCTISETPETTRWISGGTRWSDSSVPITGALICTSWIIISARTFVVMKGRVVSNGRHCRRRWLGCWLVKVSSGSLGRVLAGLEKLLRLLTLVAETGSSRCNSLVSAPRKFVFNMNSKVKWKCPLFKSRAQIWASRTCS